MATIKRKVKIGTVISDKMNKTRIVTLENKFVHPLYSKVIKRTTTFKVDDPQNESKAGDLVKIMESRPMSKTKRWKLVEIIERAK